MSVPSRLQEFQADEERQKHYLVTHLQTLLDAILKIEACNGEDQALETVVTSISNLGYSNVMISLLQDDEETGEHVIRAVRAFGPEWERIKEMTIRPYPGDDLLARVLEAGRPRYVPDSRSDLFNDKNAIRKSKIISQYVVPLISDDVRIGTMQIHFGERPHQPSLQCKMLDALAAHLSLTISKFRTLAKLRDANARMIEFGSLALGNRVAALTMHQLKPEIAKLQQKIGEKLKDKNHKENTFVRTVLLDLKKDIDDWKQRIEEPLKVVASKEERERFPANQAIQAMVDFWHQEARLRGCNLRFRDYSETVKIEVIKSHLQEVLSCLIVNAMQAKARNIDVTLSHKTQTVTKSTKELMAEIAVEDDGLGIPLAIAKRIFSLGFSTKGMSGTGMGLFIVHLLAVEMDGEIKLTSAGKPAGKAKTIFKLLLPAYT